MSFALVERIAGIMVPVLALTVVGWLYARRFAPDLRVLNHTGAARDDEFHRAVGLRCINEPAVIERSEVAGRHPHAAEVGRAERPEGQGGHG